MKRITGNQRLKLSPVILFKKNRSKCLQNRKYCIPLQPKSRNNGAIAQLVEQRTENPCVPGSIPGGTTLEASYF